MVYHVFCGVCVCLKERERETNFKLMSQMRESNFKLMSQMRESKEYNKDNNLFGPEDQRERESKKQSALVWWREKK